MLAGEQLVEHHAGRVHVAGRAHPPAGRLLGRHICDRADHIAVMGERVGVEQPRDAEIHHLDVPFAVEHHVLRLHVAMDDALTVREGEGLE